MSSNQPVRFETIEKKLGLDPGLVTEWAKQDGFPAAEGSGVAVQELVVEWARSQKLIAAAPAPKTAPEPAPPSAAAEPEPTIDVEEIDGERIVWVTIRVPVAVDSAARLSCNPVHSMKLTRSDAHIRRVMGQVFAACNRTSVRLSNGQHVDKSSQAVKWVFEQIDNLLPKAG